MQYSRTSTSYYTVAGCVHRQTTPPHTRSHVAYTSQSPSRRAAVPVAYLTPPTHRILTLWRPSYEKPSNRDPSAHALFGRAWHWRSAVQAQARQPRDRSSAQSSMPSSSSYSNTSSSGIYYRRRRRLRSAVPPLAVVSPPSVLSCSARVSQREACMRRCFDVCLPWSSKLRWALSCLDLCFALTRCVVSSLEKSPFRPMEADLVKLKRAPERSGSHFRRQAKQDTPHKQKVG